jgi:hypothetical protein
MNLSRVKIYDALYNQIADYIRLNYQKYAGVPQFMTMSKVYRPYEKNLSDQQPSFYLTPGDQAGDQDETGWGITRWKMEFYAIFFLTLDSKQTNPTAGEVLLSMIDMIDDSLFNNAQPQTLASQNKGVPMVWNAWIDHAAGRIEIRLPILTTQAAVVIPISVLTGTQLNGRRTQ